MQWMVLGHLRRCTVLGELSDLRAAGMRASSRVLAFAGLMVAAWLSLSLGESVVVTEHGSWEPSEHAAHDHGHTGEDELHPFEKAQRRGDHARAARRKLREMLRGGAVDIPGHAEGHSHSHGPGEHHSCVHDLIMDTLQPHRHYESRPSVQTYEFVTATPAKDSKGRRLQTGSGFQTIRFHVDTSSLDYTAANPEKNSKGQVVACYTVGQTYTPTLATSETDTATCQESDILTTEKKNYLRNVIIAEAVQWFRAAFSVRPVLGNLVVSSGMFDESCYDSGWVWYSFKCCENDLPSAHKTTGVPNADFVLYVTARPTGGSTLAWALTCQSDQYSRPIAGHANFSPARISTSAADKAQAMSTAIHEISHSLGFSSSHFGLFRKTGTLDPPDRRSDIVASYSEFGKSVSKIITPKTVAAVKDHFGCSSWTNAGAELEDGGSAGTAGSHLEKRIFGNEFMTGTADPNSVYSSVTLSIFEDSGWYAINYAQAEKLPWGYKQGCDFVRKTCGEGWSDAYFCGRDQVTTGWAEGCTNDRRYRAKCNLATNPFDLLPQYRYFSDPKVGGTDLYYDYCPYYRRLGSGDCRDPSTIPFWYYGETVGSTSMCFTGTFQRSSLNRAPTRHSACVKAGCSLRTNLLEVTLVQGATSTMVTCPAAGGPLDLESIPNSGFVGVLDCPVSSSICTGDPCDVQTCNGHGRCQSGDGSCVCESGYIGSSIYECDRKMCPGASFNNATQQYTFCSGHGRCNFDLGICETPSGQPGCDDGWRQSSNSSVNDCGERGCPLAFSSSCGAVGSPGVDASGACECAGRGVCLQSGGSSVCQCPTGWMGAACDLRDCPGTPDRCGGLSRGACDAIRGVCSCIEGVTTTENPTTQHYVGVDCGTIVPNSRPFPAMGFLGEKRDSALEQEAVALDKGAFINAIGSNGQLLVPNGTVVSGTISVLSGSPKLAGDTNSYGRVSVSIPSREYRYFKFYAPAADAKITVTFLLSAVTGLDPNGATLTLGEAGLSSIMTASYVSAGFPPSALSAQFNASYVAGASPKLVLSLEPSSGVGGFSEQGWIRVAIISIRAPLEGSLSIERDACANIVCATNRVDTSINGGQCRDGRCPCLRSITGLYGWSGADCSVPDCPGTPDCGGTRGTCKTPEQLGTAGTGSKLPSCKCNNPSLFSGESCNTLNLPVSTRTPGVNSNGLYFSNPSGQFDSYSKQGGITRATFVTTGAVDVGEITVAAMLDPNALASCCGFVPGSMIAYIMLDAVSMPGRNSFNISEGPTSSFQPRQYATSSQGIPDPILLARAGSTPTLANHDEFDSGAWASNRPIHEVAVRLPSSDLYFVSVMNGRYATARLEYSVRVEIVSGAACPPSINDCSGHSTSNSGSPCASTGSSLCQCQDGWEGLRCDIPAPTLLSGDVASVVDLSPGAWKFFVLRAPTTAAEVVLRMRPRATHSALGVPGMLAVWESSRDSAKSLARLQGASAMVDYDRFVARNASQTLRITRNNPSAQRFLYIGVHNAVRAKGSATVDMSVIATSASSLVTDCPQGSGCQSSCSGKGAVTTVNGEPVCTCDFGWQPLTRCASPLFSSFVHLADAAQQIDYLCTLCESVVDLPRDGMSFFKAQRPLQRGTALKVTVRPPAEAVTTTTTTASIMGGSVASVSVRQPQEGFSMQFGSMLAHRAEQHLDEAVARKFDARLAAESFEMPAPRLSGRRALQTTTTNASLLGNPSLLIADSLPRSVLDFVSIQSSPSLNETAVITENTTTSSSVWVTLYAQTEGRFVVSASRAALVVTPKVNPDFFQEVLNWLLGSLTGQIVLGVSAGFLFCAMFCCITLGCCPGARKTLQHQAQVEAAKARQELAKLYQSTRNMRATEAEDDMEAPSGLARVASRLRVASRRMLARQAMMDEDDVPPPGLGGGQAKSLSRRDLGGVGRPALASVMTAALKAKKSGDVIAAANPMHTNRAAVAAARALKAAQADSKHSPAASRRGAAPLSQQEAALVAELRRAGGLGKSGRKIASGTARIPRPPSQRRSRFTTKQLLELPPVVVDFIPPPPPRG
jgi:hypothetical protein